MKVTDQQIIDAVYQSTTLAEAARFLNIHLSSLVKRTKRLNIHFPNPGRRGIQRSANEKANTRIPLNEILDGFHPQYGTTHLKKRLIDEGIFQDKCNLCSDQSSSYSRILDHINGVHNDHRRSNLRLLCPNCNAQQKTHAGRNKRKSKPVLHDEPFVCRIIAGKSNREILLELNLTPNGANYRRLDRLREVIKLVIQYAQLVDPEDSNPSV